MTNQTFENNNSQNDEHKIFHLSTMDFKRSVLNEQSIILLSISVIGIPLVYFLTDAGLILSIFSPLLCYMLVSPGIMWVCNERLFDKKRTVKLYHDRIEVYRPNSKLLNQTSLFSGTSIKKINVTPNFKLWLYNYMGVVLVDNTTIPIERRIMVKDRNEKKYSDYFFIVFDDTKENWNKIKKIERLIEEKKVA